jgi:hypothetical protein
VLPSAWIRRPWTRLGLAQQLAQSLMPPWILLYAPPRTKIKFMTRKPANTRGK